MINYPPCSICLKGRSAILTGADGEAFVVKANRFERIGVLRLVLQALRVTTGIEPAGFNPLTGTNTKIALFDNLPAYRSARVRWLA